MRVTHLFPPLRTSACALSNSEVSGLCTVPADGGSAGISTGTSSISTPFPPAPPATHRCLSHAPPSLPVTLCACFHRRLAQTGTPSVRSVFHQFRPDCGHDGSVRPDSNRNRAGQSHEPVDAARAPGTVVSTRTCAIMFLWGSRVPDSLIFKYGRLQSLYMNQDRTETTAAGFGNYRTARARGVPVCASQ